LDIHFFLKNVSFSYFSVVQSHTLSVSYWLLYWPTIVIYVITFFLNFKLLYPIYGVSKVFFKTDTATYLDYLNNILMLISISCLVPEMCHSKLRKKKNKTCWIKSKIAFISNMCDLRYYNYINCSRCSNMCVTWLLQYL